MDAKAGEADMEGAANEETTVVVDFTEGENITKNNNDDEINKIDQQNQKQQEVQEVERKPISEITEVRNVHDIMIYALKLTIERLKSATKEESYPMDMDKLLYDINQLEMNDASAKIEDIEVPKTLADLIGFNKV